MGRGVLRQREWLLLPGFALVMLLAIRGYFWLTGRTPIDDPGEVVSFAYRCMGMAFVMGFVGFTMDHFCGWNSERPQANWFDRLLDNLCVLLLLWFFAYWLWH